ncbi:MAG: acyl carrier protein [Cyclobacteriaceae bacterium]|nr:acyl carrier protein [Cyclobacteriaceae bacterium]
MEEQLKEIMGAVFNVDPSVIDENTAAGDLEKWDSLHHMNLVAALEEAFDIEFDEEEMLSLMNYKLILLTLQEKVQS